jgi:hypothetical protein
VTAVVNKKAGDFYTARSLVLPLQFVVTPSLFMNYFFASWLTDRQLVCLGSSCCGYICLLRYVSAATAKLGAFVTDWHCNLRQKLVQHQL